MKVFVRIAALILIVSVGFSFSACADEERKSGTVNNSPTVDDILNGGGQTTSAPVQTAPPVTVADGPISCATDVDVDLTVLSGTMVYSEVYNMLTEYDSYIGKSVRMKGTLAVYFGDEVNYYAVLIADATACCAQGLEFVLINESELSFPEDYPTVGSTVTVSGTFETYTEDGNTYCRLTDAVFE